MPTIICSRPVSIVEYAAKYKLIGSTIPKTPRNKGIIIAIELVNFKFSIVFIILNFQK